jgi:hypothetical protein
MSAAKVGGYAGLETAAAVGTTGASSSFWRRWTWRRGTAVEPPLTGPLAGGEERRWRKSNPSRHGWEERGGWGKMRLGHSGQGITCESVVLYRVAFFCK